MTLTPVQQPDVSVTKLYTDSLMPNLSSQNKCSLLRHTLQEGVDLLVWQSHFANPLKFNVHDDMGRIHFTCALNGTSHFSLNRGHHQDHHLSQGNNCINYTPDCRGVAHYDGQFESMIISVEPRILEQWGADIGHHLQSQLNTQCCCQQRTSHADIHTTAASLSGMLKHIHRSPSASQTASPLWLLGQSMVLISLMLEQHCTQQTNTLKLSQNDKEKLLQAKERLLADLTQAPTIATLAHETGLSVIKIKRGFRLLFNNSVYGLFQAERMKEAKRRLTGGNVQVMTVATDLGYANASHFTSAFQKQFGVNPSTFKHCF